jgi:hypothetical protein
MSCASAGGQEVEAGKEQQVTMRPYSGSVNRAVAVLLYLWQRFLWLGWIGKTVTVIVALYGIGWVVGSLGADSLSREFGSAGAAVIAVLATALIIRLIWQSKAGRPRR